MSYSFRVRRDEEGLHLLDTDSMTPEYLANFPMGTFQIGGHHVKDGEEGVETCGVSIQPVGGWGKDGYVTAQSGMYVDKRPSGA